MFNNEIEPGELIRREVVMDDINHHEKRRSLHADVSISRKDCMLGPTNTHKDYYNVETIEQAIQFIDELTMPQVKELLYNKDSAVDANGGALGVSHCLYWDSLPWKVFKVPEGAVMPPSVNLVLSKPEPVTLDECKYAKAVWFGEMPEGLAFPLDSKERPYRNSGRWTVDAWVRIKTFYEFGGKLYLQNPYENQEE